MTTTGLDLIREYDTTRDELWSTFTKLDLPAPASIAGRLADSTAAAVRQAWKLQPPAPRPLLSASEAAHLVGVSPDTIRKWVTRGTLHRVEGTGRRCYREQDVRGASRATAKGARRHQPSSPFTGSEAGTPEEALELLEQAIGECLRHDLDVPMHLTLILRRHQRRTT